MRRKYITFTDLVDLENKGFIQIYSYSIPDPGIPGILQWHKNYLDLTLKYPKIDLDRLLDYIECEYVSDIMLSSDDETHSITWIPLYAKDLVKLDLHNLNLNKDKYVYILTNEAYPGICKIGKAINPQDRLNQINGAGTVSEWKLRYAHPVTDDYKVENYIHRYLQKYRRTSDQGSSREFFEVSLDYAIDTVNYYARDFHAGEPIVY